MTKKIAAGNWKMNKTFEEGQILLSEVVNMVKDEVVNPNVVVVLCVPSPYLSTFGKMIDTDKGMRKVSGVYPKYELVSSHIGRRSLASNFYGKIPTSYLIYITGHGSEAQFLNYIGKSNKDLALEIGNYF